MKTAVANRAEETQTCFPSSKLLPANQFLRAPKAWNYLKEKKKKREGKKKKAAHLMWSENGFGKKSWVEPWSELSSHVPKTALSTVLGSKLTSEQSHKEEQFTPSEGCQRQAGRRNGHQELTAHTLRPALDRSGFWMVLRAKCASSPDWRTLKFAASCYLLGGTRQNFLAMNPNLPENLKGKNKNGTVIFCLLIEY